MSYKVLKVTDYNFASYFVWVKILIMYIHGGI
jgi:hypothetical protein